MKKENRAVNSLSPTSRRFLAMTATVTASMSKMLFAAGDDLGITAYLDTIRSILMAIGVMAMGGVVLIIAPTLVETIFGSSLGDTGA